MPSISPCRRRTNDISGTFGAISRVLRMLLQSAILGLGAYLTIKGELSAGAIIACSVASARALAPVDLAIGNWKNVVGGAHRLAAAQGDRRRAGRMRSSRWSCRLRKASLKVEKMTVAAPGSGRVLLSEVEFELKAGQALGVIGPSGGGKTTLVRALTGIWPTLRGSVRLDDAELTQWRDDALGRHIGYLPQDVGADGRHDRGEHLPLRPGRRSTRHRRRGKGRRRSRDDRAHAGRLPHRSSARRACRCRPASASASGLRVRSTRIRSWSSWTSRIPTSTAKARPR